MDDFILQMLAEMRATSAAAAAAAEAIDWLISMDKKKFGKVKVQGSIL